MAAELESLINVDALQFDRYCNGPAVSAPNYLDGGVRPESRIHRLTLVLESLWLFYEAMRSGKPLTCGDESLAQIRAALRSTTGTRRDS
jgi:hypothetical protein